MPLTAKLSRKFYEHFGDDVATEFVDWFNAVDADYRAQLKETNDLNWERFKAELRAVETGLRSDMKEMEARLRAEMHAGLADLRSELHREIASVRKDMADFKSELLKWMFIYWTGAVVTLGGLIIALSGRH